MLWSMVLIAFMIAPAGLFAGREYPRLNGWVLALLPLALFGLFCFYSPAVLRGSVFIETYRWVPQLGLSLIFVLDGLSLLFALLICGIGTLVVVYAGYYLAHDPGLGRFFLSLLLFMGAMLGLVLAGNTLALFLFWELTSVSSYLLIGHRHEDAAARRGAQQALLITAGGGLALLLGLLLLAQAAQAAGVPPADAYSFGAILAAGKAIAASSLYSPALLLIVLGCATKSAQFPFHFWLPSAMQAPTPASAYLHSATMVKAGIYLLARLHPAFGDTPLWRYTLSILGAVTLLVGAVLALRQHDMKALLAYSTVSQLGVLVMLLGVGGQYAQRALVAGILAHGLYKGALFMVVGIVDHEAHTRDLRQLGGLRRQMPLTAGLAALAGLSMAGMPLLFGFVAKELLLTAALDSPLPMALRLPLLAAAVVGAALAVAAAWRVVGAVFWGPSPAALGHGQIHDAPLGMLLGPAVPAALGLLLCLGLLPATGALLGPAAAAIAGTELDLELRLWHGLNLPLLLSVLVIGSGAIVARFQRQIAAWNVPLPCWLSGDRIYDAAVAGLVAGSQRLTVLLQGGKLRNYVAVMLVVVLAVVGPPLLLWGLQDLRLPPLDDIRAHELIAALLIPLSVLATIRAQSRMGAIIAVGVVGAMVSLFFVLFGAPDLALTQLLIEVLSVVFLLLAFYVLPTSFETRSSRLTRTRDALIAVAVGALMGGLTLMAATSELFPSIAPYYLAQSAPLGQGENVVNVILVDFRGFDTMGEITVLFIAALGIYGLLRMRRKDR